VGQLVACGLHGVQEAVQSAAGLLDVQRHVDSFKITAPPFSGHLGNSKHILLPF
jgi:hypothetical protein